MKICVFTLGCKVNKYESDVLINKFSELGYDVTENLEFADYYVINTCAVTAEAEKKSRQCIARVKKINPNAKILICGCASENNGKQFEKEGVVYISGTGGKSLLTSLPNSGLSVSQVPNIYEEDGFAKSLRFRSYVKIQDGCNNFCSYCIIPYLRGRSRSRNLSDVINEIYYAANTSKEIVITGIDISSYGKDNGKDLTDIISNISNVDTRIRLGSLEMHIIDDRFLTELTKLKHFCPHFHLSLQSGSDEVLKSMNRHYTAIDYKDKINLIRKYFPNAGITTDIIVGFPTEDSARFNETKKFILSCKFADIHCFKYSQRKGTMAYKKYKALTPEAINCRMEELLLIKNDLKQKFAIENLNIPHEVLFEDKENDDIIGYTENYIKFYSSDAIPGKNVLVTGKTLYKEGIK